LKPIKNIFYILIFIVAISSCNNNIDTLNKMSNKEFIAFVSTAKNNKKGIKRIDSIMKLDNNLSIHKRGLIHYAKAGYLFKLQENNSARIEYNKALELYKQEGNKKSIGITYNRLGVVDIVEGKYDDARQRIDKALKIFREENDKDNELVALDSKAHIAFSEKKYKKAKAIVEEILTINIQKKDFSYICSNYNNLGYLSELLNNMDEAEGYYKKALEISNSLPEKNTTAMMNMGGFYYATKNYPKSIKLYLDALKIEAKNENLLGQQEIYEMLVDSLGKYENPFDFMRYQMQQDSINTLIAESKNQEQLKQIEDQYKLIAKEKALNQEIRLNNKNKWIFVVIVGLLLFLGLFLFQRNKNTKLKLNHDNLILEQKVLRSQMNPHFIFNALTSIQKNLLEDDILKSSSSLSKFAKLIRQNFEFISKKHVTLDEDLDMLKNYIETQQLRFDNKFDYEINIQKGLDISYIQIPPMLLQPFVENAIEHGLRPLKEKGDLTITIVEVNEYIQFEIIDNGIGFKQKVKIDNREHATDIFLKRLQLRNLGEEKFFKIAPLENKRGTKVTFLLKL